MSQEAINDKRRPVQAFPARTLDPDEPLAGKVQPLYEAAVHRLTTRATVAQAVILPWRIQAGKDVHDSLIPDQ